MRPDAPASWLLRPGRVEDAEALGALHVTAWRAAYRGLFPDDLLEELSVSAFAERHRRRLLVPNPPDARVWVVEGAPGPLGFSIGGSARDADLSAEVGEVYALYLRPEALGRGLGRALFRRSRATLSEQGRRECVVWVAEGNARALTFYEAAGFTRDTTAAPKAVVVGGRDVGVAELRLRGPLAP